MHRATTALVLLTAGLASADDTALLRPVDGPAVPAELQAVDARWNFTFTVDGQPRTLAAEEVLSWGRPRDAKAQIRLLPTESAQLLLADGGRLVADVLETEGDELIVDAPLVGEKRIPLERLRGVLIRPPTDPRRRDQLVSRLDNPDADSDRVIPQNGDVLPGNVLRFHEQLDRSGVTPRHVPMVEFNAGAGPVSLELDRVSAVAFNPNLMQKWRPRGTYAVLGLADGSRLTAESLEAQDGRAILRVPGCGLWQVDLEDVVWLQVFSGGVTYVSDLEPDSYRHIPFLTLTWPYHRDRNVLGTALRHDGREYLKGIGMHSTARLTIPLDGTYRRFEAEAALDDAASRQGSVMFRVFVDAREAYRSPIVRGGDTAVPVSVDLTGAKRISLIVDFAERGDIQDHADWLNARLVK